MRRQSREIALQLLFQSEFAPQISTQHLMEVFESNFDKPTLDYANELIEGVANHREPIDSKIQAAARNWKVSRMATVDRNILRIATFELKFATHPLKETVVIDEAVEIAKKYGTEESASFINGVLDQVSKS